MPVFETWAMELARRLDGLSRGQAVEIAMKEYGMTEAAAHGAVGRFIGARSGLVNVRDINGRSNFAMLADALTSEHRWKPNH